MTDHFENDKNKDSLIIEKIPSDQIIRIDGNEMSLISKIMDSIESIIRINNIEPMTIYPRDSSFVMNGWSYGTLMKVKKELITDSWFIPGHYGTTEYYFLDEHNWMTYAVWGRTLYDSSNNMEPFENWDINTFYDSTMINCISKFQPSPDSLARNCIDYKITFDDLQHNYSVNNCRYVREQFGAGPW